MRTVYRQRRLDWLCLLSLALLTIVFFWRVALLGEVLLPLDMLYVWEPWLSEALDQPEPPIWNPTVTDSIWQIVPVASYASEAWRSTGPPFWDPYVLSGLPGLARGDMFLNPFYHFLNLFLPLPHAMSWLAVIHIFLGSLFMFLFLRELGLRHFGSLIGSLGFGFNTYLIGWLALAGITSAMVWIPLVFFGVERALRRQNWRWLLIGSVGYSLQILEGNILWPFYSAYALVAYLACRGLFEWFKSKDWRQALSPLICGGATLIIGAALVAPQLLATVELYFHTGRTGPTGASSLMPVKQMIRLLVPDFFGNPLHGNEYWGFVNYTETDLYFGVLPLLFVAVACVSDRRALAWCFAGPGLIALLAVYGIAPFTQFVAFVCPVFLRTFPGRMFFVTAFLWAVTAAIGADWLERARPTRFLRYFVFCVGALAGALLLLAFWTARFHGMKGISLDSVAFHKVEYMRIGGMIFCVIGLCCAAVVFDLWKKNALPRPAFVGLVLVLTAVDVSSIGMRYNPSFDREFLFPETPSIRALKDLGRSEGQPYRILNMHTMAGMSPQYYRLPTVGGYSSFVLRRYSEYAVLAGAPARRLNYVSFEDCCNKLIDALNVKYVYGWPKFSPEDARLEPVYEGSNKIFRNEDALPRAWIVHRVTEFDIGDTLAVKKRLAQEDFDPRHEALIEGSLGTVLRNGSAQAQATVSSYGPERVELMTSLEEPGFLVMSDAMFPGWEAYVDGRERPILTTNLFMRGVYLEAGRHEVVFKYVPKPYIFGSYLSGTALLLIVVILLWKKGRRFKRSASRAWTAPTRVD